ncbi:hypothetical protein L1987_31331 [Smallanthus sonchifolius]|uniref:Uncharacterized protein n=1 Tax=Smallanthus sonchifolius TaxID=185202 RepID=A0ACB9I543_9ASTR|nr:hypothetical protein L1987_31331 [Smallanthus sonchifolius]
MFSIFRLFLFIHGRKTTVNDFYAMDVWSTNQYFNLPEVQKAFHANITSLSCPWKTCSDFVGGYWTDFPLSLLPFYKELIAVGLRVWMFSSDTNAVVPLTATRYSIGALNLSTIANWYP